MALYSFTTDATGNTSTPVFLVPVSYDSCGSLEIIDSEPPSSLWHLPRCAPKKEAVRPALLHSSKREIRPQHFRCVRTQQRRRERRNREPISKRQ